jgi:hypothetical protein
MTMKGLLPVTALCVLCACNKGSAYSTTCVQVEIPPTTDNTIGILVDSGPQCVGYTNGVFASVTFCVPGTATCQTIDHLLVDTGSVGLRVLESELLLDLPTVMNASGLPVAECTPFVDGTMWGPLKRADVMMGGESATNLPIQLIGEGAYAMPANCTGTPITNFETLDANGILGVGVSLQDCGTPCAPNGYNYLYYGCSSAQSCKPSLLSLANQVAHPVAAFPVDNNGTMIQLPSISAGGVPSVTGLLIFGIGTQPNNGLGAATVLTLDGNGNGYVNTTFPVGGTTSYSSFIDSGSNGLFFLDAATSKLQQCTSKSLKDFYCPTSTTLLNATLSSTNGASIDIQFSVANASTLNARAFAISNLAGPMPGFSPFGGSVPSFDWGLPFYYGRNVYTGIEERSTPDGVVGPYFAF